MARRKRRLIMPETVIQQAARKVCEAYEGGYIAYGAGLMLDDNPHTIGQMCAEALDLGWRKAERRRTTID